MARRKQVFIISDLHLGAHLDKREEGILPGIENKVSNTYSMLANFIMWINERAQEFDGNTEIIINGDFFDFLADYSFIGQSTHSKIWTSDEHEAINQLKNIMVSIDQSSAIGPIEAFNKFINDGHEVTIIIGNHDVELSLPSVRRFLSGILTSNKGRVNIIFDGESYVIGRLLVEHGNRYDRWNMVNHSSLRQERSMISRGLPVDETKRGKRFFLPPPGTFLVVHLINKLKEKYKFIDLLKPEAGAVVPLLLALEPDLYSIISMLMKFSKMNKNYLHNKLAYPAEPSYNGNLGGDPYCYAIGYEPYTISDLLVEELGHETAALFSIPDEDYDLLGGPERKHNYLTEIIYSTWGKIKSVKNIATEWCRKDFADLVNDQKFKRVYAALQRLSNDNSFNISRENDNYLEAAYRMAECGKFQVIVFGHTHLPKKIVLQPSHGHNSIYLNSGSWLNIMKIPESIMRNDYVGIMALKQFISALSNNNFAAYIRRYLSYIEVIIEVDGSIASAELFSYCGIGNEKMAPLTDSNDGCFSR